MQGDDSSLVPGSAELLEALSRTVVRGRSVLLSCHELIPSPRFGFAHSVSHIQSASIQSTPVQSASSQSATNPSVTDHLTANLSSEHPQPFKQSPMSGHSQCNCILGGVVTGKVSVWSWLVNGWCHGDVPRRPDAPKVIFSAARVIAKKAAPATGT